MTEPRYDELFTAIAAHRDHLVEVAGRLAEKAEHLRELASLMGRRAQPRWARETSAVASDLEACAVALATGIEALHRKADAALDETQPMALADLIKPA